MSGQEITCLLWNLKIHNVHRGFYYWHLSWLHKSLYTHFLFIWNLLGVSR